MPRGIGWLLTLLMALGIGLVLFFNFDPAGMRRPERVPGDSRREATDRTHPRAKAVAAAAGAFREEFVGDPVEREAEHLEIAAVYFRAVPMDGMEMPASDDAIHLEADVRATAGNPNGFALGQFIPYLRIHYTIQPVAGGDPLRGALSPMVARDGLHYGATVVMPGAGDYRLTYRVEPPSSGGLGRHSDPVTGVSPWWDAFEVSWNWHYERPEALSPAGE